MTQNQTQESQKTHTKEQDRQKTNRLYKSRIFEMVFSDKRALLSLYNAVNGTDYRSPELLEINTLENAIYMSMRNDISFIIGSRLSLYEHQSTSSPNLPLRCLMYVTDLYSGMTKEANLYGTKRFLLPTPRFVIFYNGKEELPDRQEMKLSASFEVKEEEPSLELRAVMYNINAGHNRELMERCRELRDYAEYTRRVREYAEKTRLEEAVERAIRECNGEGILREFLLKNRMEANKMSLYEYDEEKHMRMEREEWREIGKRDGEKEGAEAMADVLFALLSERGTVSSVLKKALYEQEDLETLKNWITLAARSDNIEQFQKEAGL